MTADEIIRILDLQPHPEGGAFRETYRSAVRSRIAEDRCVCTAIYFLVRERQRTEWHRVKHDEIYHFYKGSPLTLSLVSPEGKLEKKLLGNDLTNGERPQVLIPGGWWQSAEAADRWTLIGCTVSPGFDFSDFELSNARKLKEQFPNLTL